MRGVAPKNWQVLAALPSPRVRARPRRCHFHQGIGAVSRGFIPGALLRGRAPQRASMVLTCDDCGHQYWLKLGEQQWLARKYRGPARPSRCVECSAANAPQALHGVQVDAGKDRPRPMSRHDDPRHRAIRLSQPIPDFDDAKDVSSIRWSRFQVGATDFGRLSAGEAMTSQTEYLTVNEDTKLLGGKVAPRKSALAVHADLAPQRPHGSRLTDERGRGRPDRSI